MTFEKWWEANINTEAPISRYDKANAAWDFQQKRIDVLEDERKAMRSSSKMNAKDDKGVSDEH